MSKTIHSIVLFFLITAAAIAQAPTVSSYILGTQNFSGEMLSNSIVEAVGSEQLGGIFLATGGGVSRFDGRIIPSPGGGYVFTDSVWTSYTGEDNLGKGGVSAVAIAEGLIWAATAFDTATSLGHYTAGGGLSWTADPDTGWAWIPQPVDDANDTTLGTPTTTNIQNITYDIAIVISDSDTAVWTASFGGGVRKYSYHDDAWYNIPPDEAPFDAYAYYNHRGFSVTAAESLLFVGTAGGINKTADGGNTWENFNHADNGLSGNFVTALGYQRTASDSIIWAATWSTDAPGEYYSVSKSRNWGRSWIVCHEMDGMRAHNFGFQDSIVYAATDEGLFKSVDFGDTWYQIPPIHDPIHDYTITEPEVYCAHYFADQLWVGTSDGLASTPDYGNNWWIYRAFKSTAAPGEAATYAYPNPYSPQRWEAVRLQYNVTAPATVTVKIYDFAMEHVRTVCEGKSRDYAGDYYETWDGRNSRGVEVANGVYFYRVEKSGQGSAWGKIVILD